MVYNLYIKLNTNKKYEFVCLAEEEFKTFLKNYNKGGKVFIEGQIINLNNLEEIRIYENESVEKYRNLDEKRQELYIQNAMRYINAKRMINPHHNWEAGLYPDVNRSKVGKEVTSKFLNAPAGYEELTVQQNLNLNQRKSKQNGKINVLIASPSDIQVRDKIMNNLETRFRRENYEELTGYRLIVRGWEELASQTGYGQDIINKIIIPKIDIILAIFKHKLGSSTKDINTGKIRNLSGTVEELKFALENKSNSPLGMLYFYKNPPRVSAGDSSAQKILDNWNNLVEFKKSIADKILYDHYEDEDKLIEKICKDLFKNIRQYFA